MFLVHDGCTHGELLEMTQEDYDLDKKNREDGANIFLTRCHFTTNDSEQANTPLMHVMNDRQVRNLIELSMTHFVRLCVSSQH